MQLKKRNGIIVVAVTAIVLVGAWYLYSHTKRFYASKIVKFGGSSGFAVLLTFDEGYLKAWAKGLSKGKETFVYNGNSYYTQGGLIVK